MALVFPSGPTQGQTHEGFEFDSTIGAWKLISSGSGGAGLSNWTEDSEGNLIPDTDNTIDLGSAEFNIRDMYVSNNSLWMGDRHKFGVTSAGKIKISKVRADKVPKLVENAGGDEAGALTHAGVGQLHEMRLRHWIAYRRTLAGATGKETPEDVFDTEDAAEVEEVIELDETAMALKSAGAAAAGVTYSVNSLSDTNINALVNGQMLGVVGGEWVNTAVPLPPPSVYSVSPTTFGGDSGTEFTCVAANVISGSTIEFKTSGGASYTAATTTVVSSTSVKATTPRDFTVGEGPLSIVLTIPGGSSATLSNAIQTGGSPVWTTAAGLIGDVTSIGSAFSSTVAASDPDGQTLTYSVESGSLAPGLSLNSTSGDITGTFSGTITAPTTYTFTIRADDTAGNSADRQFSTNMIDTPPALYDFDYIYFRNTEGIHLTGNRGRFSNIPWLMTSAAWYDDSSNVGKAPNTNWTDTYLGNYANQFLTWTVPEDATYRLYVRGARGGAHTFSSNMGGFGASVQSDIALTEGEILYMIVGRMGWEAGNSMAAGSGGGASVIATGPAGAFSPLIIAGGGGGAANTVWGGLAQVLTKGGGLASNVYGHVESNVNATGTRGAQTGYMTGAAAGWTEASIVTPGTWWPTAEYATSANALKDGGAGGYSGYNPAYYGYGGWGGGGPNSIHGAGGGGGFHGGDETAHGGTTHSDGVHRYIGQGGTSFLRSGVSSNTVLVAGSARQMAYEDYGLIKITKL